MIKIIIQLLKVYGAAKDLHYSAFGAAFYGQHLLFDQIADDCLNQIDQIKENFFLARGLPVPTAKETYSIAAQQLHENSSPDELRDMISATIALIDETSCAKEIRLTEGEKTMIGDISDSLAKKLGFLNRLLTNH